MLFLPRAALLRKRATQISARIFARASSFRFNLDLPSDRSRVQIRISDESYEHHTLRPYTLDVALLQARESLHIGF